MRIMSLLSCFLLGFGLPRGAGAQDREAPDPYSLNAVRFSLRMRSGGQKYIHSATQKELSRLGDRVSIALLKILDAHQLAEPQVIKEFLAVVRDAFASPQLISCEDDRQPQVTRFLLEHLLSECADPQVKQEITAALDFIERQATGEPQDSQ